MKLLKLLFSSVLLVLVGTYLYAREIPKTETMIFETQAVTLENYEEKDYELRAVWVATAWNLNIGVATNQTTFENEYRALIDRVKSKHMNAIFFQVRPMNDAWYESDFAPFSKYMSGTENVDPGWDVMAFMIDYAHQQGIEFHAWMNPYRVVTSASSKSVALNALSTKNFARINQHLVIAGNPDSNGNYPYILNPGEPQVKEYIINVVEEIMDLYDIDGIHYDDYFYPYSGTPTAADATTFSANNPNGLVLEDWRRENVNDVVRLTMEAVEAHNLANSKTIRFGISPFGIWKNGGEGSDTNGMQSYYSQFADSRKWVKEGWVHYINPQVYWQFTTAAAPYANVVDWWVEQVRGTGVDLVIGHSISAAQNWGSTEIQNQLLHNAQYPEIVGSAFYSAAYLNTTNVTNVVSNLWKSMPLGTDATSNVVAPTVQFSGTNQGDYYSTNVTMSITAPDTIYYRIDYGTWTAYTAPVTFTLQGTYAIHVKSVNNLGEESLIQGHTIVINKVNNDIPVITPTGSKTGNDYNPGVSVEITTNSSNAIWVAINHGSIGPWELYTNPIVLTDPGNYYIQTKTITSEGSESQVQTLSLKVAVPCYSVPSVSFVGTGANDFYQSAVMTLTGQTAMQYRINDGVWVDYSTPVTFDQNGDYNISYRNNDGCKVVTTKTIVIDNVIPNDPVIDIIGTKEGIYYITEVTASLSVEDDSTIYYRLHDGSNWTNFQPYTEPFNFYLNNLYTLEYYAIDVALNQTETFTERFRMNLPPVEDNLYVIRNGEPVKYYQTNTNIELPTVWTEKEKEVRAVWVATVSNIDVPLMTSIDAYKAELIEIIERVKAVHMNTIFFQVRPMNDAFYYSDYAPMSRYINGTEGADPGFDILEFMVEEGHKRGIEIHAWLNPYRVSTGTEDKMTQLNQLHDENFAKQHPEFVIADNQGKLILNPGEPSVRAYLEDVVSELITNYDIDGIHFDDYFYSYGGMTNAQDAQTFSAYNPQSLSLSDWRRDNVNQLVEMVFNTVENHNETHKKNVQFGISPFGIWKSGGEGSNTSTGAMQSYVSQYADTKKWVEEGWVHYIMPQLYWQFDHSAAPYADLVDWWADLTEAAGVDLIIGHGFYRYAETSNNWVNENEFLEQLRYASQYPSVKGHSLFSYKTLNSADAEVVQALERMDNYYWTTDVKTHWYVKPEDPVDPEPEDPVCEDNEELKNGVCVLKSNPLSEDQVILIGASAIGFIAIGVVVFFAIKKKP